ncbi:hypothetical protein [Candidatus Hodarchaeum mangrovi]
MNYIEDIFSEIREKLEKDNEIREEILKISRKSIRTSSVIIRHLHRREIEKAELLIQENKELISNLNELSEKLDPSPFGILLGAYQEYAESMFLYSFLNQKPFLTYKDLNIPYLAYLHGITDYIGELRRVILDALRKQKSIAFALETLDFMDDLYSLLITLDFPDGLTYNLRKKTDFVRNLTEKTRGDVVLALNRENLVETINELLEDYRKKN